MGRERILEEINRRNSNLSDIEVYEMKLNPIEQEHLQLVEKKKRKEKIQYVLGFLIFGVFSGLFMWGGIGALLNNDIKEVWWGALIFLFFGVVFFLPIIKILKQIFRPGIKKCQYAHVTGKYKCRSSNNKSYYINVIFEDTDKRFAEVSCTEKEYNKVTNGERILVISFDNEIAEACLLN